MKHAAFIGVLSLAVAGAPQQRPVFRAGVELVQVDVVVRDRTGVPVRGLIADDFVILDRGKPQQVATFQSVNLQKDQTPSFGSHFPLTTRLDVSSNQVAEARRLVVVVLDDLHGYRGRDDVVKKIARGIVEELGSDVLLALLMTSGDYNVEPTEDRSRIMAGIERFKGARAVRRPMQAADDRRGGDLQEFDANLRLYGTLEAAARLFSGTDGRRKAFVLVSENLAKDLSGVLQNQVVTPDDIVGGEQYVAGNLEGMNTRAPLPRHDEALLEALESLRKSNVVTYAIDPRGAISEQDLLQECHPRAGDGFDPCIGGAGGPPSMTSWIRLAQQGLRQLSDVSGGFAIVNSSDFIVGISRIVDDLDNYYLLGFNTDDTRTQGVRRLEVQVKGRRDLQLRYRRGYEIGANAATRSTLKDPVFELVASALPKANVPLRLSAAALPGSGREARVPIALEITVPRQPLEEADRTLRDQLRYTVVAVDMRGSKVKETAGYGARLALRPRTTGGEAPNAVTYQIGLLMNLAPGRYHLRALASSTKLEDGGSVYLPFEVPDFTNQRIAVSSLVVGYGSGPRVPAIVALSPAQAEANRRLRGPAAAAGSAPAAPGGLPFFPTLDRELQVTDDVGLYFEVHRKDRAREITLDLMAIDRDDRVVRRFGQRLSAGSAGKVSVRLPLREIGTGAFRLRVHASDGVNEASSEVPIVIR